MSEQLSQDEYLREFEGEKKKEKALNHALDIRKFEIELYWKRATYFWAFIVATFAGYGAVQASSTMDAQTRSDLSVVLSCVGIVFSFGWFCANKGSKQWQENWENHVDMLEDDVVGPLYKTVLKRPEEEELKMKAKDLITGPDAFSVSKINQITSLFVTVLWLLFLRRALTPLSYGAKVNWEYVTIVGLTLLTCGAFLGLGKTDKGDYFHIATKRGARIQDPEELKPCP